MSTVLLTCFVLSLMSQNPVDLATQLASQDARTRQEAIGLLEEIGRPALPALRVALKNVSEPGYSHQLVELIDIIEHKRLLRATKVELVERETTVSDAVADLGRRARIRLTLDPVNDSIWLSKKVNYVTKGPTSFWEALDRLGEVSGFRLDLLGHSYSLRNEIATRLVRSDNPPIPTNYVGPYRVDLLSLNRHRQVTQVRTGLTPKTLDEFTAMVSLIAEPGIVIERNGSPRILEATDDKGANLRPASTFDPSSQNVFPFRVWRGDSLSTITYKIPIGLPESRGGTLKRFRGVLPINAVARTGPIMTFPLEGSEGRSFQCAGVTVAIEKIERIQGMIHSLQINVRGERAKLTPGIAAGPRQLTTGPLAPGFHPDDHIQILDNLGRAFQINSNIPPSRPDGSYNFRINLPRFGTLTAPITLCYYELVGEAIEVPFEFLDVQMP